MDDILNFIVYSGYISLISTLMLYIFSDARKMMEKKQNRINGAYLATQLLHTTHIVWPNSASEVLLAGSFDGWTSQVWFCFTRLNRKRKQFLL